MSEGILPNGWTLATIDDLVGIHGVFRDGDWVESKDQDQNGQVRLIQLADVGDGEFKDKSCRFLTPEKAAELNCTFLENGDVLVARMPDPLGRACLFPLQGNKKFVTVVDVCVIRFGHNLVDVRYFMYALNSPASRKNISDHQTGSTRKRISRGNLSTIQFPIAPLQEQHRIVAKIEELFSELDKGVEYLKTAQAQLKVYRQALLKHAFEGKLTSQWREQCRAKQSVAPAKAGAQPLNDMDSRLTPSRGLALRGNDEVGSKNDEPLETADTLLKRIQQERAQRYQQQLADWEASGKQGNKPKPPKSLPPLTAEELAELPELPEGWGWIRLGDIFSDNPKNGIYKSADNYGSGFSIIRIDDFYDGVLCRTSGFKKIKLSANEIKTFTACVGDILINRVNSIEYLGKCCEIRGLSEPVVFESNIMKVTLANNLASNFFVTSYLSSHLGRKMLCVNAKHAVNQASINQTDVSLTPIPLAQLGEQIAISELLGAHLSEIDQLDQTITTALQQAEALRQSILKKAFSGQLVPQDPDDEPASELLARIKAERLASQGDGVVRRKGRES